MFSRSMREALEAKTIVGSTQAAAGSPNRLPMGDQRCPECGWPVSQLQSEDGEHLTGPLYEHRSHIGPRGGEHLWPQLHACEPAPDDCPFCKDCVSC